MTPPLPSQRYMINEQGWQRSRVAREALCTPEHSPGTVPKALVVVEVASLSKPSAVPDFTKPGGELNDDQILSFAPFPTPTREGAVEIVSAQGQGLTLRAESGKI
jgi:hypothetical protein